MVIRSERTIYQLLEARLREAAQPMTCNDLMDFPEIHKEALNEFGKDVRNATNKLSDALGFMWRRGLLTRYPAPKTETSFARFSYTWDHGTKEEPARPISSPVRSSKTGLTITEHSDCVEIEFDKFVILVRPK